MSIARTHSPIAVTPVLGRMKELGADLVVEGEWRVAESISAVDEEVERARRAVGLVDESARGKLLKVEGEKRVPMPELYQLFKGEGSEADVWLAVEEGDPDNDERTRREFFANYYLGLYKQAAGKLELADELIGKALEIAKSNEGYIGDSPGGQLRAGDIARVHSQQLRLQLADQRAWIEAQKPRSNLGAKLAYMGAGIGLVVLIGFGIMAQRKKPSQGPAVEAKLSDEPVEASAELAGKSST